MNTPLENPIRVLVVDDSIVMRTAITRMIESDPELCIAGTARSGTEAIEKAIALGPDVITLDVIMPGLNGVETLKKIMQEVPRPVIMVSSLVQEGAETTLEALASGAFDCIAKPQAVSSLDLVNIRDELIAKLKAAHQYGHRGLLRKPAVPVQHARPTPRLLPQTPPSVVALGTSTGGPKALQEILPILPADLPVGLLIVQHMPLGFTGPFARRLNNLCKISVREAEHENPIESAVAYVAPAGRHMTVARESNSKCVIHLSELPDKTLHRPSVDVMMQSVADVYGSLAMGVIMTGMGADGVEGMKAIAGKGGFTIGQDEASCTVYGMPRSCAEVPGLLKQVVSLHEIPQQIVQATRQRRPA